MSHEKKSRTNAIAHRPVCVFDGVLLCRHASIRFMKDKYSPRLLSAPGKLLVLFASALLLTAGIYGVTQVMLLSHCTNLDKNVRRET